MTNSNSTIDFFIYNIRMPNSTSSSMNSTQFSNLISRLKNDQENKNYYLIPIHQQIKQYLSEHDEKISCYNHTYKI